MNKPVFISSYALFATKFSLWIIAISVLTCFNTALAKTNIKESLEIEIEILSKQGEVFFQQGDFENAIIQWKDLTTKYQQIADVSQQVPLLIKLATAYQALGQYPASIDILHRASQHISKGNNPQQQIVIMNGLGSAHLAMGQYQRAGELLQKSVDMARNRKDINLLAVSLNNLGNLKATERQLNQALVIYSEATTLAHLAGNKQLEAKSYINATIVAFEAKSNDNVAKRLEASKTFLKETKNNHNKAFSWLSLGQIALNLIDKQVDQSRWLPFAYHAFKQAEQIGENISDKRAVSYAKGYLGKLYSREGRYDEALQLTRQAVFIIEEIQAAEILYQWQWQIGKILNAKGDHEPAIQSYQQAVSTLHPIQQSLSAKQHTTLLSWEEPGAIYLELADLLLQASDSLPEGEKYQENLVAARYVIEQLKAAELQNYFKDDCVSALQQKIKALESIDERTAVVYPILLADRIEILLSVPNGLKRFTIPTKREDMINEVRHFRQKLENRSTREYLPHAQKLYQWLITPLQNTLKKHKINTLVMVPDEFLRTIPMAALHDGNKFLIEEYAIANTQGLNITNSKPISVDNAQLLAIGISESVQGFPALPHVATELTNVNKIFGGQVLQNSQFLLSNVQNELKQTPYNIVHIASHGQFKSNAQENFILTFDSKINMNGLEQLMGLSQFRKEPVELLMLSACQTAAGDDRAALGLAGIALKAGARSAVATLWFINDQASSILVTEFYNQLKEKRVTKALAIKNAQVHLIKNTPYLHPYFWSPFLLIGNWL